MQFNLKDFFGDISNFLSFKRVLGVDIGTASIKMVEVARVGDAFNLENYGILETKDYLLRANEAIQTSSLKIVEEDAVKLLRILVNEIKPQARRVIASVPVFSAFVVPLEMPRLSREETAKSINFQARQYIPLSISSVSLDWVKIEDFENQRGQPYQRVLLTAIPNDFIRKYKMIFASAGLTLAALEIESLALVRTLAAKEPITAVVLDIGAESSSIAIIDRGVLRSVNQIDYGGLFLTQALSRVLNISAFRAEELKRRRGLQGGDEEYELSTSLMPFLDVIIRECERARASYERSSERKVERLVLVGGGANLPGIRDYLKAQMKLDIQFPQTLSYLKYPGALEPLAKVLNNELSLALGVAFKAYTS